jgi:hypothetical protein
MPFEKGQRVQLHPDTDTAVGDRWGEVVMVGDKYVHVLLGVSGHLRTSYCPRAAVDRWSKRDYTRYLVRRFSWLQDGRMICTPAAKNSLGDERVDIGPLGAGISFLRVPSHRHSHLPCCRAYIPIRSQP